MSRLGSLTEALEGSYLYSLMRGNVRSNQPMLASFLNNRSHPRDVAVMRTSQSPWRPSSTCSFWSRIVTVHSAAQHKRSPCPIACTLDILGDKWTLLLIRDMLFGRSHFNEFCRSPEKIATNILADRLEKLLAHGLAEKYTSDEIPVRDAYRLTAIGRSLKSVLEVAKNRHCLQNRNILIPSSKLNLLSGAPK